MVGEQWKRTSALGVLRTVSKTNSKYLAVSTSALYAAFGRERYEEYIVWAMERRLSPSVPSTLEKYLEENDVVGARSEDRRKPT
jgi:hypothetical protein